MDVECWVLGAAILPIPLPSVVVNFILNMKKRYPVFTKIVTGNKLAFSYLFSENKTLFSKINPPLIGTVAPNSADYQR